MNPLELRITNFRSVRGTQAFRFPQEPGLYFMQGVNELEPRLEANGAGKSTVWDALCWLAFEKTPSKLRAGDVCNWDADKGTVVELDYTVGLGELHTARRTWKPNAWVLVYGREELGEVTDLTKADSNQFLADLGMAFTPFLNSVLTAQRQPMFLDMDRNAQAALFSDVLGLDRWLGYSAEASKKAAAQDAIGRGLERELSNLEGRVAETDKQDFRQSAEDWERDMLRRVDDIEAEHTALVDKGRGLKAKLEEAQEDELNARALVAVAQPSAGMVKDMDRAQADCSDYEMMLEMERINGARAEDRDAALAKNAACPSCEQALGRDALARERRKCDGIIAKARGLVAKYERELALVAFRRARMQKEADVMDDALQSARGGLDDAQRRASARRREYDLNERELDRLEERGQVLAAETNPYRAMEVKAREDGHLLRQRAEGVRRALDDSNERHALLSFWVRGFKELRLVQIAEALTELEIEVNNAVTALGLVDWEISFQVDRETKGGGVQRGFNAFVRSPHNSRAVPWEAWSGGEAQRLRVAGNMGLADLIRSRTGAGIPLEVWDEPTAGLSPQGVDDLLHALAERARVNRRTIWLIDHQTHDFGGFAGGAIVTKTAKGSAIAQY